MKREEKRKIKLHALKKIKARSNILFGQFSSKTEKKSEWEDICFYAKSIGAIHLSKDWTYLRDVWWPNERKATSKKIENKKNPATCSGKEYILDDLDDIIIDIIIGSDTPAIYGLHFAESSIISKKTDSSQLPPEVAKSKKYTDVVGIEDDEQEEHQNNVKIKRERMSQKKNNDEEKQKETSMDIINNYTTVSLLQIQLLKAKLYLRQLECRRLELELGIERSDITKHIKERTTHFLNS